MNESLKQKFPLEWPVGYPRTVYPKRSSFKNPTLGRSVQNILNEINRLNNLRPGYDDPNVVISSDVPLRLDGLPRADYFRSTLKDKGVAVYFKNKKVDVVICCDKWDTVESNMHAIFCTIEALRSIERWGVSDFINRSFAGFKAIPETAGKYWGQILEFGSNLPSDFSAVTDRYKTLAKKYHPDLNAGDSTKMQDLNQAYSDAKKYYGI